MQAVGIIAEYNPFHNGHYWHVQEAKRQSGHPIAVAVMSGHFMQRGEPAIFDKWIRASWAVRGGVDLVIELPTILTVRSAQYFAEGAIQLLQGLGCITHFAFGSENPDTFLLRHIAQHILQPEFQSSIRTEIDKGTSYAATMSHLLKQSFPQLHPDFWTSPNNILALEYIKTAIKKNYSMLPLAIPRKHAQHKDISIHGPIASATAIRNTLMTHPPCWNTLEKVLPAEVYPFLQQHHFHVHGGINLRSFEQGVLTQLRSASPQMLEDLPEATEGLHNRLKQASLMALSISEILESTKTKRYPLTRLQRLLCQILLNLSKKDCLAADQSGPLYARVLAFNNNGRHLLQHLAKTSTLPLITKTTHYLTSHQRDKADFLHNPLQKMLAIDTIATDIYSLGNPNPLLRKGGRDFTQHPFYHSGI